MPPSLQSSIYANIDKVEGRIRALLQKKAEGAVAKPDVMPLAQGEKVTNILGSKLSKAKDQVKIVGGSYIKHWEDGARRTRDKCCALNCDSKATSGGHVKLARRPATAFFVWNWYIVPTCSFHNKKESCKSFPVKGGTIAVEAPPSFKKRVDSWEGDYKKAAKELKQLHIKEKEEKKKQAGKRV